MTVTRRGRSRRWKVRRRDRRHNGFCWLIRAVRWRNQNRASPPTGIWRPTRLSASCRICRRRTRCRLGQFSDSVRWWSEGLTARQTARLGLPPRDALPHGPTNLQPVLEAIAAKKNAMATELLLLTDADVEIDDPAGLAQKLQSANIHFHLLAIANGRGLGELQQIVTQTGGSVITQLDPAQWAASIQRLLGAAAG